MCVCACAQRSDLLCFMFRSQPWVVSWCLPGSSSRARPPTHVTRRDSARHHAGDLERIVWTYVQAGKTALASSALTVVAAIANLASWSRHLREIGVLLAFGAMFAWVVVSAAYVPLCLIDERYFGVCPSFGCGRRCRRPPSPSAKD